LNYELVNVVYEKPVDDFNREMGIPLWEEGKSHYQNHQFSFWD